MGHPIRPNRQALALIRSAVPAPRADPRWRAPEEVTEGAGRPC